MRIRTPGTMPNDTARDVTKRRLKYTVDGGEQQVQEFEQANATFEIVTPDQAAVSGFVTMVDGAGNESQPGGSFSFTASDTTAPPAVEGGPTFGTGESLPE
jgi:hypothetical protein